MLDSGARKYVQPLFTWMARGLVRAHVSPNVLTVGGLLLGLGATGAFLRGLPGLALGLLWLSGLLDVLDGSVARLGNVASPFGALMDLVFDRIVEVVFILGVSFSIPSVRMGALFLLSSIIFSFSVFLAVGALLAKEKDGGKAFYYQGGLAERTETFLVFSGVILWPQRTEDFFLLFTAMILFTGFQRMKEAYGYFEGSSRALEEQIREAQKEAQKEAP